MCSPCLVGSRAGARGASLGAKSRSAEPPGAPDLLQGGHITYTQASPVRAASVAHCLGNRHAHSTHPRLPPPPSRLRASATAARWRTPPSPPTSPLAPPSALPPPPPSPLPATSLPAASVACTLAPASAPTACASSSPSLSLSESTITLRLRFRALPLPPPASLRLPTTASCSRLRLPRFSLRPSRLRSAARSACSSRAGEIEL